MTCSDSPVGLIGTWILRKFSEGIVYLGYRRGFQTRIQRNFFSSRIDGARRIQEQNSSVSHGLTLPFRIPEIGVLVQHCFWSSRGVTCF